MKTMSEITQELDRLISTARAGVDTTADRAIVLSSVALLVEQVRAERGRETDRIVEEYRRMVREARGHA